MSPRTAYASMRAYSGKSAVGRTRPVASLAKPVECLGPIS